MSYHAENHSTTKKTFKNTQATTSKTFKRTKTVPTTTTPTISPEMKQEVVDKFDDVGSYRKNVEINSNFKTNQLHNEHRIGQRTQKLLHNKRYYE